MLLFHILGYQRQTPLEYLHTFAHGLIQIQFELDGYVGVGMSQRPRGSALLSLCYTNMANLSPRRFIERIYLVGNPLCIIAPVLLETS